jgi:hypothetical protein
VTGSGHFAKLVRTAVAVFGAALLVAGCSSDTIFPAVHDMPTARTETTMTPDQVKQATDSLVSERDHLNNEAQSQASVQPATNAPATTGSVPQKKAAATTQPAAPQSSSDVSAYARQ